MKDYIKKINFKKFHEIEKAKANAVANILADIFYEIKLNGNKKINIYIRLKTVKATVYTVSEKPKPKYDLTFSQGDAGEEMSLFEIITDAYNKTRDFLTGV